MGPVQNLMRKILCAKSYTQNLACKILDCADTRRYLVAIAFHLIRAARQAVYPDIPEPQRCRQPRRVYRKGKAYFKTCRDVANRSVGRWDRPTYTIGVFIRNLLMHLAKKTLQAHPIEFRRDYPCQLFAPDVIGFAAQVTARVGLLAA